jgi:hypothetical protein
MIMEDIMSSMRAYYISRTVVAVGFSAAFLLMGAPWWQAALILVAALIFFYWAPRSGRYAVDPGRGITALQRDERTQGVTTKAGRNAWVVMTLVGVALVVYSKSNRADLMPVQWLSWLLILGVIAYFASDVWYRRT